MPLIQGKSPKAFESNLKAEIGADKPQKQALAIAYAVKRRNMAKGGIARKEVGGYQVGQHVSDKNVEMCAHGGPLYCNQGCYMADGGQVNPKLMAAHEKHLAHGGLLQSIAGEDKDEIEDEEEDEEDRDYMAEGGPVQWRDEEWRDEPGVAVRGDMDELEQKFNAENSPEDEQNLNEEDDPDDPLGSQKLGRKLILSKILGRIAAAHKGL